MAQADSDALLAEFIAFDPMHEIDFNGGFSECHYCKAYSGEVYSDGVKPVYQDVTHAPDCLWKRAND